MDFRRTCLWHRSMHLFYAVCLFVILLSCADSPSSDTDDGTLRFNIVYQKAEDRHQRTAAPIDCAGEGIDKIEVEVYGPDNELLAYGDPWDCTAHSGVIDSVKAGSNRTIVILGNDSLGHIVFYGRETGVQVLSGVENNAGDIDCHSFKPVVQSPADGAEVGTDSVVLQWETMPGADEYHLIISEDSAFTTSVTDTLTDMETYKPSGLSNAKTYFWRIYPEDIYENVGPSSEIRTFTISPSAIVPTGKLPDTGQQVSYTDLFGEDSDYDINPPSYTKLDGSGEPLDVGAIHWSMVKDNVTGLIWEVKTDDDAYGDKDQTFTWEGTRDLIDQLNRDKFGGRDDWRLPTIKELATLVNYSSQNPAINTTYFTNTPTSPASYFWASHEFVAPSTNAIYAWGLSCNSGIADNEVLKTSQRYARAVCGEPNGYGLDNILVDNGDGTVSDTKSGLMWQKIAPLEPILWENALTYCEELSLAGYDDWRLPNIKELQSILDYKRHAPTIDPAIFPETLSGWYWSSTAYPFDTNRFWTAAFRTGYTYHNPIDNPDTYVRAVRGGQ
jgi:hypothetical protein